MSRSWEFRRGSKLLTLYPVYEKLGIHWATSLLGFIALALIPIPFALYKFGPTIRAKSKFETHKYE